MPELPPAILEFFLEIVVPDTDISSPQYAMHLRCGNANPQTTALHSGIVPALCTSGIRADGGRDCPETYRGSRRACGAPGNKNPPNTRNPHVVPSRGGPVYRIH